MVHLARLWRPVVWSNTSLDAAVKMWFTSESTDSEWSRSPSAMLKENTNLRHTVWPRAQFQLTRKKAPPSRHSTGRGEGGALLPSLLPWAQALPLRWRHDFHGGTGWPGIRVVSARRERRRLAGTLHGRLLTPLRYTHQILTGPQHSTKS